MRNFLLGFTALASVAGMTGVARAQDADGEIVITATKRPENVQDVSMAVTALSAETLSEANITGATEIRRLAPSLQYSENATVRGTGFTMRGVGTQTFSNGVEQSVATVVDGVTMSRNGMGNGDLLDLDHVEVLRGPQGMLFGRNASAGVVSLITRRPTDEFEGNGRIVAGSNNRMDLSGVINVPLTEQLAIRVAGFSNTRDGLIENVYDGNRFNDHEESGYRARLAWESVDGDFDVLLSTDRSVRDGGCCMWTVRNVIPGSPLALSFAAAGIVASPENLQTNISGGAFSRSENSGTSLEMNWRFGGFTLTSLTALREWQLRENADSDSTPVNGLDLNFGRSDSEQFSQELRLTSPSEGFVDYVVGLYYFNSELDGHNGQQGSFTLTASSPLASRYFNSHNESESAAIFGQARFHVTDDFRIIAGARYTEDDLSMDYVRSFFPGTSPASAPAEVHPTVSASNTSWRLGVETDLGEDVLLYATASRGYKGPGFNALVGAPAAALARPVEPEIPTAYEIGLKASFFDGALVTNWAIFETRFEDFQAQMFDSSVPPLGAFIIGNAGELRTRGVELEFRARPTDALSFGGAVSYQDAVYADFQGAACWAAAPAQPDCAGGIFDASGVDLPNSPDWTVSLQSRYEHSLSSGLLGFITANWFWQSEVNDSLGDPNMVREAYGLLGGSIGVEDQEGRWQASVFVRNALDDHYTGTIIATPLAPGSYSQTPVEDAERLFGVALEYRFGE